MLKKNPLALALALCFAITGAQAQKITKKDSTTVIIFNSGTVPGGKQNVKAGENQILKIEPLGFLVGKIPLSYERKITDLLSVQITAGITTKNHLESVISESSVEGGPDDKITFKANLPEGFSDESEPLNGFENRNAKLGYMFSLQPRVHFENEGLEGSYIALSANFYKYNYSIPGLVRTEFGFAHTGPSKNESKKINDFMVIFGWEHLFDNLTVGYSVGAGIRNISGVKYIADQINDQFYEFESAYTRKAQVNAGFGFSVGYHF